MIVKFRVSLAVTMLLLLTGVSAFAQTIKGKVTDGTNQPLPGVAVFIKGTTNGVSTDGNGNYTINNRSDGKVLVFSCLGMKEKEVAITKNVINVILEEDVNVLDETVVIGYQEVKRRDIMGAVASVGSKDATSVPAVNFTEALTGKMAGVSVVTSEGDPDASVDIKVRGTGSITQDSSPLYIVDGFPVSSIADLNPHDIKSIDVLKDAFSTAIYGSRGAYGVVLITTKEGSSGKVSVSYDGYMGIKRMANKEALQVMSPYDFVRYNYENMSTYSKSEKTSSAFEKYFGSYEDMDLYKTFAGNDWVGRVYDNPGRTQSHSVTVSGTNANTRWTANFGHMDEQAIMLASTYNRNNFSFRSTSTPIRNLTFSINTRYSFTEIHGSGAHSIVDKGTTGGGRLINALRYSPVPMDYLDVVDDIDIYVEDFGANPERDVYDNDDFRTREQFTLSGNVTWTIIPNLKLKVDGGMDKYNSESNRYYGMSSYFTRMKATILNKPSTVETDESASSYRNTNTLSYNFGKILSKKHKLDVLLGQEYIFKTSRKRTVQAEGFPTTFTHDQARLHQASAEQITAAADNFGRNDVMLSFFTRANYSYDNRYSVSAAFRADASSKFTKANRWGFFPSAAVSWNIANESFLKNVSAVNQLKLRYSYGAAGNNRIPTGQTAQIFTASIHSTQTEGSQNYIEAGQTMPNTDLKWETTLSHNLGLDFAFFKSRITGTLELYHNTTRDLLLRFPLSGTGYENQYKNIGSVLNKGIEGTLNFVLVEKKNFGLSIGGNVGFNHNEVLDLGGVSQIESESKWTSTSLGVDYVVKVGEPLGCVYGFQNDGWYTADEFDFDGSKWTAKEGTIDGTTLNSMYFRPGAAKYVDQDGDGKITNADKVNIGCTQPKATGGFNLNMNVYGFDLSAAFSFSYGNMVYNANKIEMTQKGSYSYKNLLASSAPGKSWTSINWETGEVITDPVELNEYNKNATIWSPFCDKYAVSTYYMEDGSYIRLNSLTLGYTIPQAITSRIHMQKFRIYVSGSNLFCFTKYSGYDPEVNARRETPLTPGVDYSAYPKSRAFIAGINVTF